MIQAGVRSPQEIIQMVLEEHKIPNAELVADKIDERLAVALASMSEKPFKGYDKPGSYLLIGLDSPKRTGLDWVTYETHTN